VIGAPATGPIAAQQAILLSGDATFGGGAASLTPEAQSRLDKLVGDSRGTTFSRITVSGYTDALGSNELNQDLSEKRAQGVAGYLIEHGLQARSWIVHGYGNANPVASNATAGDRARNRRVEVALQQ
jgi:OmpA-OmpF porin, OOP family